MARKPGGGEQRFVLWFGGLSLAFGLLFLGIGVGVGVQKARKAKRFETHASTARGMVLIKRIHDGTADDSSTGHYVEFRFETASRSQVRGSAKVDGDTWSKLDERGPIDVRYLPEAPYHYRVAGQSSGSFLPWLFGGLGTIFTVLAFVVLVAGLRSKPSRRKRRA
ncbi:MAG: DUF3592 domain-containing protein [Bryobacteraceae bacterium]